MKTSLHRLPLLLIALAAIACAASWATAKDNKISASDRYKAAYLMLEGQTAYLDGDYARYIVLTGRAHELDSTDVDIAGEWAFITMLDDSSTPQQLASAYEALRQRYLADPYNYYNGTMFANVAVRQSRFDDAIATWRRLDELFPKRGEPVRELAQVYLIAYQNGDSAALDRAIEIYDRMENGVGKTVSTVAYKIKAYSMANDTAAIMRELATLDSLQPNDSFTAYCIGAYMEYLDKREQAIQYYDRACSLDSTNGQAYAARAEFYRNSHDTVAYERELRHALYSPNLEVENKLEMLRTYISENLSDTSLRTELPPLFYDLEVMHPTEPGIYKLYAAALQVFKDYKGAAEQYQYIVALEPTDEDARLWYIKALMLSGDTLGAVSDARAAIERFPDNLEIPLTTSYILLQYGDTAAAVAVLDSVEIEQVHNPEGVSNFYTSKADLLATVGDTARALTVYDEAVSINPRNAMALNNAAYFMAITGGDLSKAENYSTRSLKDDGLNPTYLDTYAWIQFMKKEYMMAKLYIDMALKAYDDFELADTVKWGPEAINALLDGVDDTDELPDSVIESVQQMINKLSNLAPADVLDHAGDIYFMNGEADKAMDFWQKALFLDRNNALIRRKVDNKTIFLQ